MINKTERDYRQSKARIEAFWQREVIDRPLVSVLAPIVEGANTSPFKNDKRYDDPREIAKLWEDPETILRHNTERIEKTYLGGDTLPAIFFNFGPSGHAAYFGSRPKYQKETVWYEPVFAEGELDTAKLRYDESALERQLAVAEYIRANAGSELFLSMPDNTGTLDALATLMEPANLMFALLEQPEEVSAAVKIINEGHRRSTMRFYEALKPQADGGCIHGWMHLWAPGVLQHMQCDVSVMLSAAMYEQFVVPELQEQMQWIEYPVYHFDGVEQTKHLDLLLSFEKLRAIQWTHVAGQPGPVHFLDTLSRIQKAGKGLLVMTPASDVRELVENLDPRGLYIHTEAKSPQEADEIVNIVATRFQKR